MTQAPATEAPPPEHRVQYQPAHGRRDVWAICPCGWQQLHDLLSDALLAGQAHTEESTR